ncbi:MAG: SDR family oxidoreductase [Bacteroidetes bacterium]|nr:SDR family oxidoreductase [Bacteroidota bacterium]MCY4205577.1 SDR family oxidoreductase [Bacteroidota bacterium]
MNVLVTGATGFLGSELVYQLLEAGYHVRIFRRETSKLHLLRTVADEVEHSVGDITDLGALRSAMHGIQVVFHVAGNVQIGSKTLDQVNTQGTASVVDAARESRIEKLVHTSSIAAIGTPPEGIADETCELQNKSGIWPYGRSKYMAELEVHRSIAEGLDAVIVNPSLIIGPDRSEGKALNICHEYALKIRAGKIIFYPPGGTNVVDVSDVAAGHLAALEHGKTGRRYILGSENLSWKSILSLLAESLGAKPPKMVLPYHLAFFGGMLMDLWSSVSRQNFDFGRSSVKQVFRQRSFSNQRAVNELGCSFRPFSETAKRTADSLPN